MIEKLSVFAENGDRSIQGLNLTTGFPRQQKPYRQWMNYLFNWLSSKTNEVIDEMNTVNENIKPLFEPIHVGELFVTTNEYETAAQVSERHGYGIWVRYAQGRTLVGYSSDNTDDDAYRIMGNTFGENEHVLTVSETPSHKHGTAPFNKFGSRAIDTGKNTAGNPDKNGISVEYGIGEMSGEDWTTATEKSVGGGKAHNNIQPSIVVAYWLRVE